MRDRPHSSSVRPPRDAARWPVSQTSIGGPGGADQAGDI